MIHNQRSRAYMPFALSRFRLLDLNIRILCKFIAIYAQSGGKILITLVSDGKSRLTDDIGDCSWINMRACWNVCTSLSCGNSLLKQREWKTFTHKFARVKLLTLILRLLMVMVMMMMVVVFLLILNDDFPFQKMGRRKIIERLQRMRIEWNIKEHVSKYITTIVCYFRLRITQMESRW